MFRYSGAGDELISPVYIAPTLPPYVERTWPEDEVAVLMLLSMIFVDAANDYVDDAVCGEDLARGRGGNVK